jgi:hypothetical protein
VEGADRVVIEGEPEVGGVVTSVTLDEEKGAIGDEALKECLTETAYGAAMPPVRHGGTLHLSLGVPLKVLPGAELRKLPLPEGDTVELTQPR